MNICKGDLDDLKELFNSKLEILNTKIESNDKNYNQRFDNVQLATKDALSSADRANTKAETATEKRFDSVNEFRATLADQQRNLMPRAEVEIINKSVNDRLEKIENNAVLSQGKGFGLSQGIGWVVGIIGLVIGVIGIMFKVFGV